MRKIFAQRLLEEMRTEKGKNIVLITADMGYGLWDAVRKEFPDRFHNVGSAEQLMVGMAAGMAMEGKIPVCYSITPFLLYRPFEFIRNFMNHEKLPIKLIGGGRDKDYGYLGFTHWAEDDVDLMDPFGNIDICKPSSVEALMGFIPLILYENRPCYLNLVK
jgi:transketolase